ncbi:MAG: SbcC/MukB-like Walker B domain-containing protein [Pseudomonadota bacterium]
MKINSLRIHNLNSLKGTFIVDFDDQPLSSSAIFAIIGPTGAGKSTLLDAICVALYGQTPRLSTGESEELMTRHTGECWAEVEFTVKKGRFRSKWSQRRARGRADGKLQPSAMELAVVHGDTAQIVEEKKSRVPLEVAELTGLDFARFTRSVLLAQGSFAAFLQAKDNERADLLEKITGTESYSHISRIVYQKTIAEERKLETLRAGLDSVEILPAEELAGVMARRITVLEEITGIKGELDRITLQLDWFTAREKAEAETAAARQELALVEEEKLSKEYELKRLDLGRRTLAMKGDFQILQEQRRRMADIGAEIEQLEKKIILLTVEEKKLSAALKEDEGAFAHFQAGAEESGKLLGQVERLDEQIASRTQNVGSRKEVFFRVCRELEETAGEKEETLRRVNRLTAERNKSVEFLESRQQDNQLRRDFPLLCEQLEELVGLREQINRMTESRIGLTAGKKEKETALVEIEQVIAVRGEKIGSLRTEKERVDGESALLLAGAQLRYLENRVHALENCILRLKNLEETGRGLEEAQAMEIEACRDLLRKETELEELAARKEKMLAEKKQEELVAQALEQKDRLEQLVANYDADRKRLKKEEPCPLCGSLRHPWAQERKVYSGEGNNLLVRQRNKINQLQEEIQTGSERMAELKAGAENSRKSLGQWSNKGKLLREKWIAEAKKEEVDIPADQWRELGRLISNTTGEVELCRRKNEEITLLEKKSAELFLLLTNAEGEQQKDLNRRQRLEAELASVEQEMLHLSSRIEETGTKSVSIQKRIAEKIPPDLQHYFVASRFGEVREELGRRVSSFDRHEAKALRLLDEIAPLQKRLDSLGVVLQGCEGRMKEEKEELGRQEKQLALTREERRKLFGARDVVREREKIKDEARVFAEKIAARSARVIRCRTDLTSGQELLSLRRKEFAELSEKTVFATQSFNSCLARAGIDGEKGFVDAVLSRDEFERVEAVEKELIRRGTSAVTRLEDSMRKLDELCASPLTDKPRQDVSAEQERQRVLLEEKQGQAAYVQQTLLRQESLRREYREKAAKVEEGQREVRRWRMLNSLIGSADGQKFRRFAQGLTLDHLISLANSYLADLNDRYVLKRKKGEELGLEVMDTWQADTVRPTNTLSGGEGFLVSLALALGLSCLAGRNVSIDSLFLDEGFGTLDGDTLEMALAALDNLHSSGKTIGLISHVEALKERIPVQIRVHKKGGGASTLEIVG